MVEDISRRVMLILVIITLAVSIVASWTVLDAMANAQLPRGSASGGSDGRVLLMVAQPAPPAVATDGGVVGLSITPG